ncbi:MAG: MFS transporter [Candidatus Latescibacterota bacterium]
MKSRFHETGPGAITVTLLLASTLTVMAPVTVAPGLPGMRDHFADSAEFLTKLVLTAPALSIAIFGSFVGWLIDKRGRKRVLLWSMVLYAVAGTSGLYLNSAEALLAGRLLLGVAVAGTMTASTTLVGDYFRGADRNRVIGLQAAAMNLGGVIFVSLGGVLAEWHWRGPFLVYAASLLLIPPVVAYLRDPEREATAAEDAAANRGHIKRVLGLLVFLYTTTLVMQIAFFMVPVQFPFFLEHIGETSPSRVGLALALMTICSGTTAVSFKWIRARSGSLFILALSFGLMGVGYLFLSSATGFEQTVISLMVFGLGLGMTFPNLVGWLMDGTPRQIRGRVVGGLMTVGFAGQFLSPIAVLPLIAQFGLDGAFRVVGVVLATSASVALTGLAVKRISRNG